MPGMKKTLLGVLSALVIAGCGQAGKDLSPTVSSVSGASAGPTFAVFPVADYSYVEDVEQAYRQQRVMQAHLAAAFGTKTRILPQSLVYRTLDEAGYIRTVTYEEDIQPAADTNSLENLLNEDWSDMMKSQIVGLIKTERKRNIPGIAIQDNHLDAPETGVLDRQAVIELGRALGADYIVRGRVLEYDLHQEYEWEPMRRHILPFFRGEQTMREFGVAKATHYDPLDNIVVGGALTDLGEKGDHGLRLQVWVQDAASGRVLWTDQTVKPIGGTFGGNDFEAAAGKAAVELTADFLAAVAVDGDGDGIWDHRDRCPGTPAGVPVDEAGCPRDSDGDGVADYLDRCPGTPATASVDEKGCPADSDGDGIADHLDDCPETPEDVEVDRFGCAQDADGDDVPDKLDRCPDTPSGVAVDADGCPLDSDGDGVADFLDECPGTPADTLVDSLGCPPDSDYDGVADDLDACPGTLEGMAVDSRGCPEPMEEEVAVELRIQFDFDEAEIKPEYHDELEKVATFLLTYPDTDAQIEGHTDSEGDDAYNLKLSQLRATKVKHYLVTKFGIAPARLTARGFGEGRPVAPNETKEGRKKNRRSVAVISATVKK